MKKKIALAATAVSLLVVGVAFAVTNTYSVTASTAPTTAGTKAKPVPVQLKFNYSVGEKDNNRSSPVKQYKIKFAGIKVTQKGLKTCTKAQIDAAGNNSVCPKAAAVGTGSVDNTLGPTSDPTNKSLHCYLALTIYNAKPGHATLFLKGLKASPPPHDCISDLNVGVDAQYVVNSTSSTLQFSIPATLLHPLPGLDNSVTNVQSTIKKTKTVTVGGKKYGYYSSIGGCKSKKRAVSVTFVSEDNKQSVAKTGAKCS